MLVSRQTVSLWEKDQTVPTVDNLMRLREIFGVSVDELLDFKPGKRSKRRNVRQSLRLLKPICLITKNRSLTKFTVCKEKAFTKALFCLLWPVFFAL